MALTSADTGQHHRKQKKKHRQMSQPLSKPHAFSSWDHIRNILYCKNTSAPTQVHDPYAAASAGKLSRLSSRCRPSICTLHDAVQGNSHGVRLPETDWYNCSSGHNGPISFAACEKDPLTRRRRKTAEAAARGSVQLIRLSGCYECRDVDAEPASRRYLRPRTLCACPQCGEVFTKADSLEAHQALRHAVLELGPEDSGRHIVEIIFKSSWQETHRPICKIDRILKVHNTPRTIARFEDYRAAVKSLATASRRNPRCAADGNELLRFYSASLSCCLGTAGSTSLCFAGCGSAAADGCGVCSVIRYGFRRACNPLGIRMTASSGLAHDHFVGGGSGGRAMLVCRVIAGRIRHAIDGVVGSVVGGGYGCFDSVEGANLEDLFVANPRAILPCFVVIYWAQD